MHQHGSSNQPQPHRPQAGLSLPIRLVLYVSIGIVAYFLITEHLVHLSSFLPYSFVIIFVLMHLFMHGGNGRDGSSNSGNSRESDRTDSTNKFTSRRGNHARHE
ncbi:DUF2933 domain-containing protein [Phormidium tenue]|uniref:DUF2933 domain-containing protein n=2 Tax=Phormidium tenue TaxID=126344 RepID=A0ABR8C8E7_9CYAN|nr:DUF2933 domain-containing protein [Phormidium tenue FACHB-1050]